MVKQLMFLFISAIFLIVFFKPSNGLSIPTKKLLSGYEIPSIGLDMIILPKETVEDSTLFALDIGHRYLDCAYEYDNERGIGRALKRWFEKGGKREDVFITNKLPMQGLRPKDVSLFLDRSLQNMGLDYIDLYLIHFPAGTKKNENLEIAHNDNGSVVLDPTTDHVAIWKEMEKQVKIGKIRSIGMANFNKTQLMRIWENSEIKPSDLQMENNAYLQQTELVECAQRLGIVVSSYSPVGSPGELGDGLTNQTVTIPELINNPLVQRIAREHKKSAVQILTRFNLQRNMVVSTESSGAEEMRKNLDVLDFTLSNRDMEDLKGLDQRGKYRKFSTLSEIGIEKHPEYPYADLVK